MGWELLKLHFPGWPALRVGAALGQWQRGAGVDVKFVERNVQAAGRIVAIIVVQFWRA